MKDITLELSKISQDIQKFSVTIHPLLVQWAKSLNTIFKRKRFDPTSTSDIREFIKLTRAVSDRLNTGFFDASAFYMGVGAIDRPSLKWTRGTLAERKGREFSMLIDKFKKSRVNKLERIQINLSKIIDKAKEFDKTLWEEMRI